MIRIDQQNSQKITPLHASRPGFPKKNPKKKVALNLYMLLDWLSGGVGNDEESMKAIVGITSSDGENSRSVSKSLNSKDPLSTSTSAARTYNAEGTKAARRRQRALLEEIYFLGKETERIENLLAASANELLLTWMGDNLASLPSNSANVTPSLENQSSEGETAASVPPNTNTSSALASIVPINGTGVYDVKYPCSAFSIPVSFWKSMQETDLHTSQLWGTIQGPPGVGGVADASATATTTATTTATGLGGNPNSFFVPLSASPYLMEYLITGVVGKMSRLFRVFDNNSSVGQTMNFNVLGNVVVNTSGANESSPSKRGSSATSNNPDFTLANLGGNIAINEANGYSNFLILPQHAHRSLLEFLRAEFARAYNPTAIVSVVSSENSEKTATAGPSVVQKTLKEALNQKSTSFGHRLQLLFDAKFLDKLLRSDEITAQEELLDRENADVAMGGADDLNVLDGQLAPTLASVVKVLESEVLNDPLDAILYAEAIEQTVSDFLDQTEVMLNMFVQYTEPITLGNAGDAALGCRAHGNSLTSSKQGRDGGSSVRSLASKGNVEVYSLRFFTHQDTW